MSNNQQPPYDPYAQADPYAQPGPYGQQQPQPQGYGQEPHGGEPAQQWQGQTWDTQVQPAPQPYLPPQHQDPLTEVMPPVQSGPQQMPQHQAPPQPHPQPQDPATQLLRPVAADSRPQPQAQPQPQPQDPATQLLRPVPAEPQPQPQPEAPAADGGPAYGPATVTGNTRVTDAQRARAEGRSPIIEPGMQPAGLTAVLGLLLAGGAAVGQYALLVPLLALQAVTAAGWFRLNGMWPARQGIALAFLGGVVADIALLAAGRGNGPAAILGTLGVWVLLTLVLQLRSHADPDERMYGLMATVVSAALAIVAAGHLAATPDAVTVGGIAVAATVVVRALPLPTPASVGAALLAALAGGFVGGALTGFGSGGALLGLGAGVCALIGHRVAAYDYPSRFVHMTAGVALPLAASAPAVWLLGRALG